MFYAHSTDRADEADWQTLRCHSLAVAELARRIGSRFGLGEAAFLAGLLHDLGKYLPAFQRRLHGSRDRVDHSVAGAAMVRALARGPDAPIAELIAYAIAGHHAGLPDRIGPLGLDGRVRDFDPAGLDAAWQSELDAPRGPLMPAFLRDGGAFPAFRFALLGRMIFSCLVDADFKDTEAFYLALEGRAAERSWPELRAILPGLVARFDAHMATMAAGPEAGSPVNRLRRDILAHVRAGAAMAPGLFTLQVPTGGGKTLASLGFALDHAARHGLDRVIYAIPYMSVTEQTADILRRVLGADIVLEHHSAFDEEKPERARGDGEAAGRRGRDKLKLAMEDWAAPVVVTTTVQLFESLFSARPSRCRKLHALARSVIVLDEVQVLPHALLSPIIRAVDELAASYGTSIVLCTATQPALDARHFPRDEKKRPHPLALPLAGRELAPDPEGLAKAFRRTRIVFAGAMDDAALLDALGRLPQGLVIVNSRAHALALYCAAASAGLEGAIHLTTRHYAAHRRRILDDVRARLGEGRPCRLIATSLVEAGVDLDFPAVFRAEAGLDQIAQAAGRCNREGRRPLEDSIVTVFKAAHAAPPALAAFAEDLERIVGKHADLLSPDALADYFGEVYWRVGEAGLDRKNVLGSLRMDAHATNFAYRTVGENFRMIESGLLPVIIPRDEEARRAVEDLGIGNIPSGAIARRLQSHLVQVPPHARALLMANGHVALEEEGLRGDQFAVLRSDDIYRADVGLLWEEAERLTPDMTYI